MRRASTGRATEKAGSKQSSNVRAAHARSAKHLIRYNACFLTSRAGSLLGAHGAGGGLSAECHCADLWLRGAEDAAIWLSLWAKCLQRYTRAALKRTRTRSDLTGWDLNPARTRLDPMRATSLASVLRWLSEGKLPRFIQSANALFSSAAAV
jgi:hypothetical protein